MNSVGLKAARAPGQFGGGGLCDTGECHTGGDRNGELDRTHHPVDGRVGFTGDWHCRPWDRSRAVLESSGGRRLQTIMSSPDTGSSAVRTMDYVSIVSARRSISIANPYFVSYARTGAHRIAVARVGDWRCLTSPRWARHSDAGASSRWRSSRRTSVSSWMHGKQTRLRRSPAGGRTGALELHLRQDRAGRQPDQSRRGALRRRVATVFPSRNRAAVLVVRVIFHPAVLPLAL